jgi:hypothetical protein
MSDSVKKAQQISDILNSTLFNPNEVALHLSRDHRYLQQQFMKLAVAYISQQAQKDDLMYDERNKWTVELSRHLDVKIGEFLMSE